MTSCFHVLSAQTTVYTIYYLLLCEMALRPTEDSFNLPRFEYDVTKGKGKASSLDIAPLTILDSGALQPPKWQLTGNDCSTAAQAVAAQSPR